MESQAKSSPTSSSHSSQASPLRERVQLPSVIVRFAGDSGDGMQVTGARFTHETARMGNDLATKPDFPAEIRAPAGTLAGVSAFQIQFGSTNVYTAGDELDVLVAMNPAALKVNLKDLKQSGILICNEDSFVGKNLSRIGYAENPLDDPSLSSRFRLVRVPLTSLTTEALSPFSLPKSTVEKCKNFFALGIICYLYDRSIEDSRSWLRRKFGSKEDLLEANLAALDGGLAFAQAAEIFSEVYEIPKAQLAPGRYKNVTGNQGLAYGLLAASEKSGLPLYYSGYPITPASEILHDLARYKNFGVRTFQAEDEIAACCSAIGASYAGQLAVTGSSGPGIILKQEAIGLAVMTELPLVIINVQRAGPSTGMPTKTEQSDLLEVLFGRNGESPLVVLAIASPADAFDASFEACRIALEHMTPVVLLSDGAIGNGSQPWRLPDLTKLPAIQPPLFQEEKPYLPYERDEKTLARSWVFAGTKGCEHRIGGIEKQDGTGNISYDPLNHEKMTKLRAEKVARVADQLPASQVNGESRGDLLVLSWGGTSGAVAAAVHQAQVDGRSVSHLHLRYLNPLPKDLEAILGNFKDVLVPELNSGQLCFLLQGKYGRKLRSLSKVQGQPFLVSELRAEIERIFSER